MLLEVCVDHIKSVIACIEGGAGRIELCSALSEGGLTPTTGFLRTAKRITKIPIFVMLRPHPGGFIYSHEEKEIILSDLKSLKNAGADGFVFGALTDDNTVDVDICTKVVLEAAPLPVTFHRAFDFTNPENATRTVEMIISLGFKRILTSGFKGTALRGLETLQRLSQFNDQIVIMPGAGINTQNIEEIIEQTECTEIHASARSIRYELNTNPSINLSESGKLMITDREIVKNLVILANKYLSQ